MEIDKKVEETSTKKETSSPKLESLQSLIAYSDSEDDSEQG